MRFCLSYILIYKYLVLNVTSTKVICPILLCQHFNKKCNSRHFRNVLEVCLQIFGNNYTNIWSLYPEVVTMLTWMLLYWATLSESRLYLKVGIATSECIACSFSNPINFSLKLNIIIYFRADANRHRWIRGHGGGWRWWYEGPWTPEV